MKKSREVLDSGRITEVQTTKIAGIDLLLERLARTSSPKKQLAPESDGRGRADRENRGTK
jgi:hypothetical protein